MELYESVYQRENLNRAFLKVKKNKGCFGVDRISIDTFERKLDPNLREIQRLLKIDKYRPMPVERVYIPKSNGKKRPLGIPVVRDRVLQQAVVNIIEPKFEKIFSNCSFGFRAKKSPLQANTSPSLTFDALLS